MKNNIIKSLPWIALISGLSAILIFVLSIFFYNHKNTENTENRLKSQNLLNGFQNLNASDISGDLFKSRLNDLLKNPEISTVWFISNNGTFIYANGFLAASTPLNRNVSELATSETKEIVHSISDNLSEEQKLLLLSASAIQREGEHNDIVNHLLVPIKNNNSGLAGFIGLSYNIENKDNVWGKSILIIGILFFFSFIIYWISLPVWVYFDSRQKEEKYVLWTLFVLIGNLPAYIAYLLIRK
ncbi:MAG: hypothetical protein NTX44_01120 [Ignavibacteriales bacterium]|nr:hypothetical protein [Ignavibacteriales bacterium]